MHTPIPIIDGAVYAFQQYGGINTLFNQVVPRIARRYGPVKVLLPQRPAGPVPFGHRVQRLIRDPIPERVALGPLTRHWRRVATLANEGIRELKLRHHSPGVFQSTYFTTTQVMPSVAMVYDLNHEMYPNEYATIDGDRLRKQYRSSVESALRTIAISKKSRDDAVKYYQISPQQIDVVPLATDPTIFFPDDTICQSILHTIQQLGDRPYILYVGSRCWYKRFDTFLGALSQITPKGSVAGVAIGHELTTAEKRLIDSLELRPHIYHLVNPPDTVLRKFYTRAAAFAFPSMSEGFGIPVLEAMSCGVPALLADTAVFREVAEDAAVYYPPGDSAGLAEAVARALRAGDRGRLRMAGFRRSAEFSWDRTAEGFWASYCRTYAEG